MGIRGGFDTGSFAGSLLAALLQPCPGGASAGTDAPFDAFKSEECLAEWQQPTVMALGRAKQPSAWIAVRPLIE